MAEATDAVEASEFDLEAEKGAEFILARAAILVGVIILLIPLLSRSIQSSWEIDGTKSILLPGGSAQAEKLVNPYGLSVLEFGGKYAIVGNAMSAQDLQHLQLQDTQFQSALYSPERLTVYRGPEWTVVFAKGYTLKEALGLSRVKQIGEEFTKAQPMGYYAINESEVVKVTLPSQVIAIAAIAVCAFFAALLLLGGIKNLRK